MASGTVDMVDARAGERITVREGEGRVDPSLAGRVPPPDAPVAVTRHGTGVLAAAVPPAGARLSAGQGPAPSPAAAFAGRGVPRQQTWVCRCSSSSATRGRGAFRKALALAPGLGLARANLAIALLNEPKLARLTTRPRWASALTGVASRNTCSASRARLGNNDEAQAASVRCWPSTRKTWARG